MNKQIAILVTAILFISLLFTACDKDDNNDNKPQTDLSQTVSGSYKGSITFSDDPGSTQDAVMEVSAASENTVEMNLMSDMLDTTFMMNLYGNGDSVMVCFTGERFNQEYDHHLDEDHHMMGNHGHMDWDHHMDEQHEPGDEHYGGFDMNHHSLNYRIIPDGPTDIYYQFEGDIE
ncbi:MAG: hypothetical protein K9G67_12180 [Bacteroidales bacterium]|nr:hypothetical protein [Bacteroidales bacterium]MCF8351806.1 hypothetical protein [Bacteroidales bacterium]MCF8377106.1 hypothetical protein [Bacteroidales bacterium]MCF8402093.1 hypothetical protein [Bacteroidales bacterium]